jgi:protein TonB
MTTFTAPALTRRQNYPAMVGVLLLHLVLFWALRNGLLHQAAEAITPARIFVNFVEPDTPRTPPAPPMQSAPLIKPLAPMPLPLPDVTIAPEASAPIATSSTVAPQPAASRAKPTPDNAPPRIELPSSDADYLQNPKPVYPSLSKRLNEQGTVVIRVLIGLDGSAQRAEIATSSGYDRLDQAALATAQKWRYVPGKRNGVPEAMWFNVPIKFILERR